MAVDARTRGEQSLVSAAGKRIIAALDAWVDGDYDGAASAGPLAVELLSKGALWHVNPALLVPLEARHEAALVTLATDPSLDSPAMRTIGLKTALGRLTRVIGDLPVPPGKRQDRLVDCRNGSLHVGTLPNAGDNGAEWVARQVLADSLTLCNFLIDRSDLVLVEFYGDHGELVDRLLENERTDLQHRVDRLLAQARAAVDRWRLHVDDDAVWESSAAELEATASTTFPPDDFGLEMGAVDQSCPACGHDGRLLGRVVVEGDVDVEGGPDGPEYYSFWRVHLYPRVFACNVCKLLLVDPQALEAAGVSAHDREVAETDLGDDFSAAEWAEWIYGGRD